MSLSSKALSVTAFGLVCVGALSTAHAAPSKFSFFKVEFEPRDQREILARAYVEKTMRPGISMPQAEQAARRAGARCGASTADGSVICRASSFQHPPGDRLQDVVWTVQLRAAPNGALSSATVTRSVVGT